MKSIGFADYYISEWHANHYPEWIRKASEELGYDFEVKYAWAEKDVSDVDGKTTDDWCREYGVEKCATLKEMCEKSDCFRQRRQHGRIRDTSGGNACETDGTKRGKCMPYTRYGSI